MERELTGPLKMFSRWLTLPGTCDVRAIALEKKQMHAWQELLPKATSAQTFLTHSCSSKKFSVIHYSRASHQ